MVLNQTRMVLLLVSVLAAGQLGSQVQAQQGTQQAAYQSLTSQPQANQLMAQSWMAPSASVSDTVSGVGTAPPEGQVSYQTNLGFAQFERGRPHKLVDGVGWVLGIPRKLLLWDRRVENHDVSSTTETPVAQYMAMHQLDGVKVRVNQYDPGGEWRRLAANKRVGAGWRYTVGALTTLGYTLFPGRLIGNDSYNPYTDTVHLYSDVPALALEQAAYARDVNQRELPGTYATLQALPLVGLWHESHTKQDVHQFLATQGTPADQAEAHRILDPQFGSEVGGQIGSVVPAAQLPIQLTGAIIGHAVGRHKADAILTEIPE